QITPHTAYTNVHGVVEYGKDAEEADPTLPYSVDALIEASEVIDLAGNETKTVEVALRMPEASFEGFLAGG
ncbi:WxL protein peptidoglycan domain-containing protein, partial [Enterococcus mundtii]